MPTPEKIAIVGPASVGKTTITSECKSMFASDPAVAVLKEAAELFFARHPDIPKISIHSAATQRQLQDFVLQHERSAHRPGVRLIITDRSVVDPAIYARFNGDIRGSEDLWKRVKHWIPTYTEFLLPDPADVPYEAGPNRKENSEERFQIHALFIRLFTDKNVPYRIVSGTRTKRMQTVESVIEHYYPLSSRTKNLLIK